MRDIGELFFGVPLDDVRGVARELRLSFDASTGLEGFDSFECAPDLAERRKAPHFLRRRRPEHPILRGSELVLDGLTGILLPNCFHATFK